MLRTSGLALLLAAAALAPATATGQAQPRLLARAEVGGWFGADDVAAAGVALRATGAWRRLVVEAGIDMGRYLDGGPRDYDFLMLAGAGASVPLGARWTGFALALGGVHALGTGEADGHGYDSHALPAAGARLGLTAERPMVMGSMFASFTVAATVVADLRRERDFFLGKDVGGVTALASATVGFGFRR